MQTFRVVPLFESVRPPTGVDGILIYLAVSVSFLHVGSGTISNFAKNRDFSIWSFCSRKPRTRSRPYSAVRFTEYNLIIYFCQIVLVFVQNPKCTQTHTLIGHLNWYLLFYPIYIIELCVKDSSRFHIRDCLMMSRKVFDTEELILGIFTYSIAAAFYLILYIFDK